MILLGILILTLSLVHGIIQYSPQTQILTFTVNELVEKDTIYYVLSDSNIAYYGPSESAMYDDYAIHVHTESECVDLRSQFDLPPLNQDLFPSIPTTSVDLYDDAIKKFASPLTRSCFSISFIKDVNAVNYDIVTAISRYGTYPAHKLNVVKKVGTSHNVLEYNIAQFKLTIAMEYQKYYNAPAKALIMSQYGELPCYAEPNDDNVYIQVDGPSTICDIKFKTVPSVLLIGGHVKTSIENMGLVIDFGFLNWEFLTCSASNDGQLPNQHFMSYPVVDSEGKYDKSKIVYQFPIIIDPDTNNPAYSHIRVHELTCKVKWADFDLLNWKAPLPRYPVHSTVIVYNEMVVETTHDYIISETLGSFYINSELVDMMNEVIEPAITSNYYNLYFSPRLSGDYVFNFDCNTNIYLENTYDPVGDNVKATCANLPPDVNGNTNSFACSNNVIDQVNQVRLIMNNFNDCKITVTNVNGGISTDININVPIPSTLNIYQRSIIKNIPLPSSSNSYQILLAAVPALGSMSVLIAPPTSEQYLTNIIYDVSNCPDFTSTFNSNDKTYEIRSPTQVPDIFPSLEPRLVMCVVNVHLTNFFVSNPISHMVNAGGQSLPVNTLAPLPTIGTKPLDEILLVKDDNPVDLYEFPFDLTLPFTMAMFSEKFYEMTKFKADFMLNFSKASVTSCTLEGESAIITKDSNSGIHTASFTYIPISSELLTSTVPRDLQLNCKGTHTQEPNMLPTDPRLKMWINIKLGDSQYVEIAGNLMMPLVIPPPNIPNLESVEIKLEPRNSIASLQVNNIGKVKANDELLVLLDSSIAYYGPKKFGSTDDYSWTLLSDEACNAARVKHNLPLLSDGSPVNPIIPGLNDNMLDSLVRVTSSPDTKRCFSVKILKQLETLNIAIPISTSRYGIFPEHRIHLIASRGEENDLKSITIPSFTFYQPTSTPNPQLTFTNFGDYDCYDSNNNLSDIPTNTCDITFLFDTTIDYSTAPIYSDVGVVLETNVSDWEITHCRLQGTDHGKTETNLITKYFQTELGKNDKSKVILTIDLSNVVEDDLTSYFFPNLVCTIKWNNYSIKSWKIASDERTISSKMIMYDTLFSGYNGVYTHSEILNSLHIISHLNEVMYGSNFPIANTLNHYYLYFTPSQKQTYTIKLSHPCHAEIFPDVSISPADMNKYHPFNDPKPIYSPDCIVDNDQMKIDCIIKEDITDKDSLYVVRFALTNIGSCSIDISVNDHFRSLTSIELPSTRDISDEARVAVYLDDNMEEAVMSQISISQVILEKSSTVTIKPNYSHLDFIKGELIKYSIDNDVCPGYSLSFDETSNTYSLVSPVGISHDGVYVPTITRCDVYVVYMQIIGYFGVIHEVSSTSSIFEQESFTLPVTTTLPPPTISLKSGVKPNVKRDLVVGSKNTYNIELKFDLDLTAVPYYKMEHFNAELMFTMPNKAEFTTCFINDTKAFETAISGNNMIRSSFTNIKFETSSLFNDLIHIQYTVKCIGTHVEEKSSDDIISASLSLGVMSNTVFDVDFVLPAAEETVDVYETFLSIISKSGLTMDEREKILEMYKDAINKGNESGTATEVYIKDWVTKTLEDMRVVDEVTFSIDDDDIIREHVEDTLDDLRNEIISDMKHSDWLVETKVIAGGGEGEGSGGSMPKRCRTSCGKGCLCGLGKTCVDNQDCMSAICHIPKTPASRVYFLNESKGTCVNKIPEDDKDNASTPVSLLLPGVIIGSITILKFLY